MLKSDGLVLINVLYLELGVNKFVFAHILAGSFVNSVCMVGPRASYL